MSQSALSRSFYQHAEKIEKSGSTWVRRYNHITGQHYWVVSYKRGDINAAIENCIRQAAIR